MCGVNYRYPERAQKDITEGNDDYLNEEYDNLNIVEAHFTHCCVRYEIVTDESTESSDNSWRVDKDETVIMHSHTVTLTCMHAYIQWCKRACFCYMRPFGQALKRDIPHLDVNSSSDMFDFAEATYV
jgi:hypothetical protein